MVLIACLRSVARRVGTPMEHGSGYVARIFRAAGGGVSCLEAEERSSAAIEPEAELVGVCDCSVRRGADAARNSRRAAIHRANGVSGVVRSAPSCFWEAREALRILAFPLFLLLFLFPIPGHRVRPHHAAAADLRIGHRRNDFEYDRHSCFARWQYPGASARAALGGGGVQRNSIAAVAIVLVVGLRLLLRQRVSMRWVLLAATVPDRDRGERALR